MKVFISKTSFSLCHRYLFCYTFHIFKFYNQFVYPYIRYQKQKNSREKASMHNNVLLIPHIIQFISNKNIKVSYHGGVTFKKKTWQPDKLHIIYRRIQWNLLHLFPCPLEKIIHSRRAQVIEEGRLRWERDNALSCGCEKVSRPLGFHPWSEAVVVDHFKGASQVK